jgi:1,2-diacylglycerol 3-alpha-glucosyltransferase
VNGSRLRVAVVNNFFPPRTGGSAHLSESIARTLASQGHEVLVVTGSYGDAPEEERDENYRVVRLPSWHLPRMKLAFNFDINFAVTPRNLRRLFVLLDEFRPGVIHQHGQFFDLTWASSWYARRRRVPTVLSVHTRLEHPGRFSDLMLTAADYTLVRFFVWLSRCHAIVMDRIMERYIATRYGVGGDRLVPIPVGVEPARFEEASARDIRAELGLGSRPVILSLGHVIPVRNRLALVESMPSVLDRRPDAVCLVVGRVYDDRFLARAAELGVSEHVMATGPVDKSDIPSFVAAADVDAHDLSGYGLGTASLETMAAGVPTIAAVTPDHFPGIELSNWSNAVLVPPDSPADLADAIVRLLDDAELAKRIGEAQHRLVLEHFTMEAVAAKHVALFERLVATR